VIAVTLATAVEERSTLALLVYALAIAAALLVTARPAHAAQVIDEAKPMVEAPAPVDEGTRMERVVVAPEPPKWGGWDDYYVSRPWVNRSAPRIRVWVDRGDWSTYSPGDRLWVYFRVDRPCYVTILDYAPDGLVSTIYPSRWSGSTFASPGVTYRIPESRRYSLRIAGAGGVETLVACAHEAPWPSGPDGVWIPRHHPDRGRVVVGRPGGSPPPGWRGRVVVGPDHWPVPPAWYDYPERWSCDSVSFYVDAGHGGYYKDGRWYPGEGGYYDGRGEGETGPWDDWDRGDDRYRESQARLLVHDRFRMSDCDDEYSCGFDAGRVDGSVKIECEGHYGNDPTEVVGRLAMKDRWGDDVLFRLDAEGVNGERPEYGRVFTERWGDVVVEVEITGFELVPTKPWQNPRMEWIEFDVRVFGG
jgi:hypothetical protein